MQTDNKILSWRKYLYLSQENLKYNLQDQDYEHEVSGNISCNTITLLNMSFTNEFPNVTSTYSRFQITANNITYSISISSQFHDSFYNIFELMQIIQDALNAQTPHIWTLNTSGQTNKRCSITCNTTFRLRYDQQDRQNNKLLSYLGFDSQLDPAFNFDQLSHMSTSHFNVQVSQNVRIRLYGISGSLNSDFSTLCQIPLSANFSLTVFQSTFKDCCQHIISQENAQAIGQTIHFKLIDDLGFPIRLLGSNLNVTLLLEKYDFV